MARMEKTAETTSPKQGRFAREATPEEPQTSPPADLAALRLVERRWPRAVPEKRVFPRG
jgi:hypothetical protein